ncbi:RNA polymerase sigma factor (sigma-70 family) [Nocardioides sp. J9]|uniref:sigma-70 family RNA polymerase sigma factor n=1 Tax=Nocardioides sp. J9 TaxID=935844 RepID=UPI0011AD2AB4|nr:sigma-70 family RNA polymerase sigma factor [Nocardioides sp. J9]TWG92597.1 RNA polymerase sigma factor (sigma-70 family) [Nocardioides sp. J9]
MTPTAPHPDEVELLARARAGDRAAIGTLYEAHRPAALRMAQLLAGPELAEDLLSDAFARVVARFHEGGGPETNFHGYLFTAIRNRHRDLQRRAGRESPVSDLPWLLDVVAEQGQEGAGGRTDDGDPARGDPPDDRAMAALARLPEAWQQVLALLDIEGKSLPEVAVELGISPAAASSLAYRAREGLRRSYLDQLARPVRSATGECAWLRPHLSRYVRGSLPAALRRRADDHLAGCSTCMPLLGELERVNARFQFIRFSPKRGARTTLAPSQ